MRADLPTGTVTFLFTDIEGSTRLLNELGADEYANVLREHRRVLREAFERHGGVEVDTQGDAFFVAFSTAPAALAAARHAQAELELPVRMGLHTGTPLLAEEGYVGSDVHRAARIAAAGHGRQVLVSAATAALVERGELRDLGEHRLKDLSAPERIYQLGEDEFPALKALYRTNLPIPATPFLGREQELADVRTLLARDEVRLLTLTGTGGSGKTRLALHAAGEVADAYPDGVWWVPLAPLADPVDVGPAAVRALGGGGPLPELVDGRRLLLLLDNFEHVVEAAPEVAAILTQCPHADVLVTSRERLRVQGEQVYPVPVLERAQSRLLFVARARAAQPDFGPGERLDELCERLDDLPLALELAAARTSLLSTEQLLERLGNRLDILKGGRDAETRQRTLRATIEWSYELLEPEERKLLAALSIFRGGWTLEAAEQVADADLELMQSLVDKSLVRRWESGRFGMLETIREFAAERLEASGEADTVRRRQAGFLVDLTESANLWPEAMAAGRVGQHELFIPELANLRTAFEWLIAANEIELALGLAVRLENFWVTSDPVEGRRWLSELLERSSALPPQLHAWTLRALGGATYVAGDFVEGHRYIEESLAEYEQLNDRWNIAHMTARRAVEASRTGDLVEARELCERSLAMDSEPFNASQVSRILAGVAYGEGHPDEAIELADRAACQAGEIGFRWWQAGSLLQSAEFGLMSGRAADVRPRLRDALSIAHEIGDPKLCCYGLALLAWAAAEAGDTQAAGVFWGAAEAEAERGSLDPLVDDRAVYEAGVSVVASPEFENAARIGRAMSLEDGVDYARGDRA